VSPAGSPESKSKTGLQAKLAFANIHHKTRHYDPVLLMRAG
jgi:hypothetical protein